MNIKHKALIGAVSLLGLSGIGIGTSMASTTQTPTSPPAVTTPSTVVDVPGVNEPAGPDTDNIQDGPQTGADTQKPDTAETPEANGDNHQDPPGANVDYTPPGEQPEAAGANG
jgi:hypothetical protein